MPIKLSRASYNWALKHLLLEGDTDLLPALPEIDAIKFSWKEVAPLLVALDIENYRWKGERRFVMPVQDLAFRSATQLDPLDSLVFAAIIRKYGHLVERLRIPVAEGRVFSHRFSPTANGRFYGKSSGWHEFWQASIELAKKPGVEAVAVTDVTDFYNQIYHHVLENQLKEAGLPEGIWNSIKGLITHLTQSVSRGVPVGPHAVHLLAEVALNPVDRSMLAHGLQFCRFVDDIHLFCKSAQAAQIAVHDLATILDNQQRLTLQRQKTRVVTAVSFIAHAEEMLKDRPLDDDEEDILNVINKYSDGNPYFTIDINEVSEADWDVVRAEKLVPLLEDYISNGEVDYGHVRWLLRRLSQIGAPGAVDFALKNIDALAPALGDVARYILRASPNYEGNWVAAGELIIGALAHPLIDHSEYMRVLLLHLLAQVPQLNHVDSVTAAYSSSSPPVRREILLAAHAAGHGAWLRERKTEFESGDPWLRRALVASSASWPGDESKHWLKKAKTRLGFLEKLMIRYAFRDRNLNVGPLVVT